MRATPCLLLALALGACRAPVNPVPEAPEAGPPEGYPSVLVEGEPLLTVLERDAIPALDDPRFETVDEAFERMQPEETVLGVVGPDGTAKAYSTWQLDAHEIVNDELDGVAIAATW